MRMLPPLSTAMSVPICSAHDVGEQIAEGRLASAHSRLDPFEQVLGHADGVVAAELLGERGHPLLHTRVDHRIFGDGAVQHHAQRRRVHPAVAIDGDVIDDHALGVGVRLRDPGGADLLLREQMIVAADDAVDAGERLHHPHVVGMS
jgi:hypothetical protein